MGICELIRPDMAETTDMEDNEDQIDFALSNECDRKVRAGAITLIRKADEPLDRIKAYLDIHVQHLAAAFVGFITLGSPDHQVVTHVRQARHRPTFSPVALGCLFRTLGFAALVCDRAQILVRFLIAIDPSAPVLVEIRIRNRPVAGATKWTMCPTLHLCPSRHNLRSDPQAPRLCWGSSFIAWVILKSADDAQWAQNVENSRAGGPAPDEHLHV